tara:strand:+ start:128 stop:913 length:786 start_codon:yes stop_codon:yes gene_type:complete
MANYTITRVTDANDIYGCTNFQTTETETEMAIIGGGPNAVDGDIIWMIDSDAANGYNISVDDFDIPGTVPTSVAQVPFSASPIAGYRTFVNNPAPPPTGQIPSPVLGIVMEQISLTRIKMILYLHPEPNHGISGSVFTMPGVDISAQIPITGCAFKGSVTANMTFRNISNESVTTLISVNNANTNIRHTEVNNLEDQIEGLLNDGNTDSIVSYTVSAPDKHRFKSEPTLSLSNNDYKVTSTVTNDDDGNMISKTFNISKNI